VFSASLVLSGYLSVCFILLGLGHNVSVVEDYCATVRM